MLGARMLLTKFKKQYQSEAKQQHNVFNEDKISMQGLIFTTESIGSIIN